MSFSDEDVKRLKDKLERNDPKDNWSPTAELQALLARLEAAERCIAHWAMTPKEFDKRYEAWRKAAGKLSKDNG